MKQYRKIWIISFLASFIVSATAFFLFFTFADKPSSQIKPEAQTKKISDEYPFENYVNYDDNVGGVSFTEDQITELVRNMYSLDGYINNLSVDFSEDGLLTFEGKIKNVEKLCELFPELEAYKNVLSVIENKNITVKGNVTDNNGLADFQIEKVTDGKITLDENIVSPFVEEGYFAELFNVDYESVEVLSDSIIFKNGVPDILSY